MVYKYRAVLAFWVSSFYTSIIQILIVYSKLIIEVLNFHTSTVIFFIFFKSVKTRPEKLRERGGGGGKNEHN